MRVGVFGIRWLLRLVSIAAHDLACFCAFDELEKQACGRYVAEQHRFLLDRSMERLRHDPVRPFDWLAGLPELRQRDEAELGIARLHERVRLADVLPDRHARREPLP